MKLDFLGGFVELLTLQRNFWVFLREKSKVVFKVHLLNFIP